ncbi:MAG: hypothetical protein RIE74_02510 [Pseudomonadales bacterium]
MNTVVLQSHRLPLPAPWLARCLDSVRGWAARRGFEYRFEDDALFDRLPGDLRERTAGRPVIAADLARLAACRAVLDEGAEAVVWVDADTLVIDAEGWLLPEDDYALGREVWVQRDGGRVRDYVKVHNAYLLFRPGNPFLDFYHHAAERIVRAHRGPMAPQLIGPKLLTALHSLAQCPVDERAAVLPPAVAHDLLAGGGDALTRFRARSVAAPAALNLCGSLVGRELDVDALVAVMDRLASNPALLAPRARR